MQTYPAQIAGDVFFASRVRTVDGDPTVANLEGVLVLLQDGTLSTAPTGSWDSDARTWTLHRVQTSRPGEAPTTSDQATVPFLLETTPSDTLARPAQLPLGRLIEQLRIVRAAGGDATELTFSLHRRLADAFSAAIFATFAGAIALRVRGRAAGFAWTIVLLVGFWALWVLAGNLFESGAVQPVLAAWLTPGLAGVGAAFLAWMVSSNRSRCSVVMRSERAVNCSRCRRAICAVSAAMRASRSTMARSRSCTTWRWRATVSRAASRSAHARS